MIRELCQLRSQLLEELIEDAYAELGDETALSQEKTDSLVAQAVEAVEAATYPQAQRKGVQ